MKNMFLKKKFPQFFTRPRRGMSMIMLVMMIAAIGICMLPITRWYLSITKDVDYLSEKLEMQSIIQDHWHQLNDQSFDEFEEAIATNGNVFTEEVGDKWTVTTTFGPLGAYKNALCNEGSTPEDEDRRCRKAHIEIKSKTDPENLSLVMATTTTRVASTGGGGGGFNTLVAISESGDWVAPVSGWYKFKVKGAGGGGAAGHCHISGNYHIAAGGGGGEGGTTIHYAKLKKGDSVSISIGNGGRGGRGMSAVGSAGEDTILEIDGNQYIGGGGGGGTSTYAGGTGGFGGYGDMLGIPGPTGGSWSGTAGGTSFTTGGGSGGGSLYRVAQGQNGGGGSGGSGAICSYDYGYDGGKGIVWIEYFDAKKKS